MLRVSILVLVLFGATLLLVSVDDATADGNPWDYRMEYVVFGMVEDPLGNTVQVHINHLRSKLEVEDFIRSNTELEFSGIETAPAKALSTMYIIIHVEEDIDGLWQDTTNASVRCYIVGSDDDGVDDTHVNPDNTLLRWTGQIDGNGTTLMTIQAPYSGQSMWLIPEIGLGGGIGWFRVEDTKSVLKMYNPKKRVSQVVYSKGEKEMSDHLWLYHHTFKDEEEALGFLNGSFNVSFSTWGTKEVILKNTTVKVACFIEVEDMGGTWDWVPLVDGTTFLYILGYPYTISTIYMYWNGTMAQYQMNPNMNGVGHFTILMPHFSYFIRMKEYRLFYAASGGAYDFLQHPIDEANWTFTVVLPPEIEIQNARILEEEVIVGEATTVTGEVREVDTDLPVEDVEITLQGRHISTTHGVTDENGTFTLRFQAPLQVARNLTLDLIIEETDRNQEEEYTITYDVDPPSLPPPPPSSRWNLAIWIAVITIACAIGAGLFFLFSRGDRS